MSRRHPAHPPWMPWRVFLWWWALRKHVLRVLHNLRFRPRPWEWASLCSLHRLLDRRRWPAGVIPVIINNFNRYATLRRQVEWLLALPEAPVLVILDNASTYPPLLAYYRTLRDEPRVQVMRLGYNSALEGIADAACELREVPYYVVTDPDLVPYATMPSDVLTHLRRLLVAYPRFNHVGLSLEIEDLPPCYPMREQVRAWEARYWPPQATPVDDLGYEAWVDTTFGMYRGASDVTQVAPAMRTARPYTLQHVDWYQDPAHLTDEQQYYVRKSEDVASWTARWKGEREGRMSNSQHGISNSQGGRGEEGRMSNSQQGMSKGEGKNRPEGAASS